MSHLCKLALKGNLKQRLSLNGMLIGAPGSFVGMVLNYLDTPRHGM